ncbi:MAG: glycoside hydrolase N-terminal domain-containing protein [Candidatus Coatesbacteria bacterium]
MIEPLADLSGVAPKHGTVSTTPATAWEHAFVSGNGRMGAMVFGDPANELIIANHSRLFLPLGTREIIPDLAKVLPETRNLIRDEGYEAALDSMIAKAREQGFPGLSWTDPFHPGFELSIREAVRAPAKGYVRTTDFQTGEVATRWQEGGEDRVRCLFVSRRDNVIVLSETARSPGAVTLDLELIPIDHPLIRSEVDPGKEWFLVQNTYAKGKGGYDAAIRIVAKGGKLTFAEQTLRVEGADELLLLMRIVPWKTEGETSPKKLMADLEVLPASYDALMKPHAVTHGGLFSRVQLDLRGGRDRALATGVLLERAAASQALAPALVERMYDAGRYVILSSTGDLPPNLQGIWTGTWEPAWSGDFTLDTNLQLAVAHLLSCNTPELLDPLFRLTESMMPAFHENAVKYYGCRGILVPPRVSNTGLHLHWDESFPGIFWTCGAGWLAHWFHDYWLHTGDEAFLRARAFPFMKEVALFYRDFLFQDVDGRVRFSPSYSAENGMADNATMDVAVAKELLTNFLGTCEALELEADGKPVLQTILDRLPPYLVDEGGALKEWAVREQGEHYDHRHSSHLYPVWQSYEFDPGETPDLWRAARIALERRVEFSRETSSHGRMHQALAATRLRMAEVALDRLTVMVTGKSMYESLVTSHEPGQRIFNVDANGAIPEIVNTMLVFCWKGVLDLLPACPESFQEGYISGLLCRGGIIVDAFDWNLKTRRIELDLTSAFAQFLTLRLPNAKRIVSMRSTGEGFQVAEVPGIPNARRLDLPANSPVSLELGFE